MRACSQARDGLKEDVSKLSNTSKDVSLLEAPTSLVAVCEVRQAGV